MYLYVVTLPVYTFTRLRNCQLESFFNELSCLRDEKCLIQNHLFSITSPTSALAKYFIA